MSRVPPSPEEVLQQWKAARDERTLLHCKAESSLGKGWGELMWTTHRIIYSPTGLGSVVPGAARTFREWSKDEVTELRVQRGQPFPFNSSTTLSIVLNVLLLLPLMAVLTLGIYPVKWIIDRLFGTYLIIDSGHERAWFYLKPTPLNHAMNALSQFRSGD